MKRSTTLALLLIVSVILNLYLLFIKKQGDGGQTTVGEIPTGGFAAPTTISPDSAMMFTKEYRESLVGPDDVTGGYITTSSFEEMMKEKDCNGIYYSFARDSSGIVGPGNRGVFLVVAPAKITLDSSGHFSDARTLGNSFYLPRPPWCPPNCPIGR